MCGRFTSTSQLSLLAERFRADPEGAEGHQPSWNVAPATDILVITASDDGARRLRSLHWGLVPKWAKDTTSRNQMINLRAETAGTKPTFKRLLAKQRCIIPIDGFYEWQDMGRGQRKQPIYIVARDQQPLALAGLWESWHEKGADDADRLWTCTILTTTPNKLLATIHNRMPVILPPEAWDTWLDPDNTDADALAKLLVPASNDLLMAWPVDPAVGNTRTNRPELVEPLEGHEPRVAE